MMKERLAEENETNLMSLEDTYAWIYEYKLLENQQIEYERELMYNEEIDQCEIDRFWGIDTYEANKLKFENDLKESYIKRLQEANSVFLRSRNISTKFLYNSKKYAFNVQNKHIKEELVRKSRIQSQIVPHISSESRLMLNK